VSTTLPPTQQEDRFKFGDRLTPRELEVLKLICDGFSTREIAAALNVRFKTAAAHRAHLMEKTGSGKVVRLYRWALRRGYVSLGEDNAPTKTPPQPPG